MYKYKETYFTIVEPEMFNYPVPIEISRALGYVDIIVLFGEIVWIAKELTDGRWACSIQLIPAYKLPVQGVKDWISEKDYNTANNLFDNIITKEQFLKLEFIITKIE